MNVELIRSIHNDVWVDVKEQLPVLEVGLLIDLGTALLKKEKTIDEIIDEYGHYYADAAKEYVSSFSRRLIEEKINKMQNNSNEEVDSEQLADQFFGASVSIIALLKKFCNKEINANEFMQNLGQAGVFEISNSLLNMNGIDLSALSLSVNNLASAIQTAGSTTIAYVCFTEAYKILMEALNDSFVQHEHMLMIEQESKRVIQEIKEYRNKLQEEITKYFNKHLDRFEYGIDQMEKALLENDSNGYIKANKEIQSILNYHSQFSNQDDFDTLMSSDENFKL